MTIQLTVQPHFENETSTISALPIPPFLTSRGLMQPAPFNSRSKVLKHPRSSRITRVHERATCRCSLPCQPTGTMPRKRRKWLNFAPLPCSGSFYHPHSRSGNTAGENQPCSRTKLKPIQQELKPH